MKTKPTPDCPTEEQILGWADGTLADRTDLEAHVADCERCLGFVAELVQWLQPKPVGIICAHWPRASTEQTGERHIGGFSQRIPDRHIDTRQRNKRYTFTADEVK